MLSIAAFADLKGTAENRTGCWLALSLGVLALGLLRIDHVGLRVDYYLEQSLHGLGWYEQRRLLQIIGIAVFAVLSFVALRRRRLVFKNAASNTALGAFYVLAMLGAIRLSSLHWTDEILARQLDLSR